MKNIYFHLFLIGCIFLCSHWTFAQLTPTKGTEFWLGFMENANSNPSQEELRIFVSSDQNTSGTISIPQQGYTQNFTVTANVTTTLTIPNNMAEHYTSDVIQNKGILIETQDTVSVFAINFQRLSSDGAKILPIQSLGTNYMTLNYFGIATNTNIVSEFLIVAVADSTEIEIIPKTDLQGGKQANVPYTITLNRGQSYQAKAANRLLDLTGTVIRASQNNVSSCKPFAVFSGSQCTNIPQGCNFCDHIFDQCFPRESWGTEYYVVPFSFATNYTLRIVAERNDTQVSINGAAPITLNQGQIQEYNNQTQAVCVSANKPIAVVQYMQGRNCSGNNTGDPAMVILNSQDQKIENVTFSTVSSPVIQNHNLNVIIQTNKIHQLKLDGNNINPTLFVPFANCSNLSYVQLNIATGSHTLEAEEGFIAYVYGTGMDESYAYSAGSYSRRNIRSLVESNVCTDQPVTLTTTLSDAEWHFYLKPDSVIGIGSSLAVTPQGNEIYFIKGTNAGGCVEERTIVVESPIPPTFSIEKSGDSGAVCRFQQIALTANVASPFPMFQYSWQPTTEVDFPEQDSVNIKPATSTWFKCTVATPFGCSSRTDSIFITVNEGNISHLNITPSNLPIRCSGDTTLLQVQTEKVLLEDRFNGGTNPNLWIFTTGIISNNCNSLSGNTALYFSGADERVATTLPLNVTNGGEIKFAIRFGTNANAPCENTDFGEDVLLEYSIDGGNTWVGIAPYFEFLYPNFTNISLPIPAAARTAATQFRWRQRHFNEIDGDNWALDNVVITHIDNANINFTWTPAATAAAMNGNQVKVFPTETTFYTVLATDLSNNCTYKDSVFVPIAPNFDIILPDSVAKCSDTLQLTALHTANEKVNFTWLPDTSFALIQDSTVTIATNTEQMLHLKAISQSGCLRQDSVLLMQPFSVVPKIVANDTVLCFGELATLQAGLGNDSALFEYNWSGNFNTHQIIVQPTQNTWYGLQATEKRTNCSYLDSIFIRTHPDNYTIFAGNDTTVCSSQGLMLQATYNFGDTVSFQWQPAALLNDATLPNPTIVADTQAVFVVTAIGSNNCAYKTDTIAINRFIKSDTIHIQASACKSFTFAGVNRTVSGTYYQHFSNQQGCDSVIALDLTILPASFSSLAAVICTKKIFNWNGNAYSTAGIYTDTLVKTNGCDSILTLQLIVIKPDTTWYLNGIIATANSNVDSVYWWNCQSNQVVGKSKGTPFTFTQNGNYAAIAWKNGCRDTSTCRTVVINSLTKAMNSMPEVRIFPTLVQNELQVHFDDQIMPNQYYYVLLDALGRTLQSGRFQQQQEKLPVAHFPTGMYWIRIENQEKVSLKRWLKE